MGEGMLYEMHESTNNSWHLLKAYNVQNLRDLHERWTHLIITAALLVETIIISTLTKKENSSQNS